jgi:phenylacetate-CoA ligase
MVKANAFKYYAKLIENQYLSESELQRRSWLKTKDIIQFAYNNSEYYREAFERHGLKPCDIKTPHDILKIPILSKEDIRKNFNSILIKNCRKEWTKANSTGGSTGTPTKVLHDVRVPIDAAGWRVLDWWGCKPWDDMALVYRNINTWQKNLLHSIITFPTGRISLDASLMTEDSMKDFAGRLKSLKSPILQGYVGAVYELAQFLSRTDTIIPPLKAVWVTSAPLVEGQRHFMEHVFHAPVYDQYGSGEILWLAAECKKRSGLHVFSDIRCIEFLRDDGSPTEPGEIGDIVVTDLENRVFPLIRYRIGDRGCWKRTPCSCGVNLPLMEKVSGRISDMIRLPGGTSISGEFLTTIFDRWPLAVKNFQILQHADGNIILKCVPGEGLDSISTIQTVCKLLQEKVGDSIVVHVEIVDFIHHDRGKTRFIISEYTTSGYRGGHAP